MSDDEIDALASEGGMGTIWYENNPQKYWRAFARSLLAAHEAKQQPSPGEASTDGMRVGEVVVTKNEAGQIVAVTRQDADGRIVEVIAEYAAGVQEVPAPLTGNDLTRYAMKVAGYLGSAYDGEPRQIITALVAEIAALRDAAAGGQPSDGSRDA